MQPNTQARLVLLSGKVFLWHVQSSGSNPSTKKAPNQNFCNSTGRRGVGADYNIQKAGRLSSDTSLQRRVINIESYKSNG